MKTETGNILLSDIENITRKQFADKLINASKIYFLFGGFVSQKTNVIETCRTPKYQSFETLNERKVLYLKSNGVVFSTCDGDKSTLDYSQKGSYKHYKIGNLLLCEFIPNGYELRNYCIYKVIN